MSSAFSTLSCSLIRSSVWNGHGLPCSFSIPSSGYSTSPVSTKLSNREAKRPMIFSGRPRATITSTLRCRWVSPHRHASLPYKAVLVFPSISPGLHPSRYCHQVFSTTIPHLPQARICIGHMGASVSSSRSGTPGQRSKHLHRRGALR